MTLIEVGSGHCIWRTTANYIIQVLINPASVNAFIKICAIFRSISRDMDTGMLRGSNIKQEGHINMTQERIEALKDIGYEFKDSTPPAEHCDQIEEGGKAKNGAVLIPASRTSKKPSSVSDIIDPTFGVSQAPKNSVKREAWQK